jgi:mono/diheme cytochrome c family protein
MRSHTKLLALAIALVSASCSSASTAGGEATMPPVAAAPGGAQPEAAPAASASAVPAEQARRGQNAFLQSCTACHGSAEFSDAAFRTRWRNRTAADLFDLISSTMPEDAPNSLPAERYVDIVAYVLTLNGFETVDGAGLWTVPALSDVSLGSLSGS